jgi:hypothetical protein
MDFGEFMNRFLVFIPVSLFLLAFTYFPFYLARSYHTGISYWIGGGYLLDKNRKLRSKAFFLLISVVTASLLLTFTGWP